MHYKEVKAILSPQNGLNIYRGCSYSCVFCDARSTCHRMDHEFEDIEVKAHAVDMLEYALKKKRTRSMIQIGSSSEPYIPLEEELQLVRRCLNQEATRKYIEAGKDLEGKGFDPRKLLAPGAEAIKATVKEKMELFGSVGKA